MTSSGHVNMSASVWRRKCRNMWNMYQISPNVPSNGSEASHRWHCPQSTSHRQPRPAKHIFHSVQMDKLTNGPSWSTLLVIAARLSMVCSTYMYILYFLDLFSFFWLCSFDTVCMMTNAAAAFFPAATGNTVTSFTEPYWLKISWPPLSWYRTPYIFTDFLPAHLYDHLRAVLACFGMFYHGMSWSHVVTQSATAATAVRRFLWCCEAVPWWRPDRCQLEGQWQKEFRLAEVTLSPWLCCK